MPAPVFYASVVPIVVYIVVKKGFVEPFLREEKSKKVEKQKQNNLNKLIEKRKEALAAQELMTATYDRIKTDEENKKGLVIIKAIYGKLIGEFFNGYCCLGRIICSEISRLKLGAIFHNTQYGNKRFKLQILKLELEIQKYLMKS